MLTDEANLAVLLHASLRACAECHSGGQRVVGGFNR
jgi:hypothetical protein